MDRGFILITDAIGKQLHSCLSLVCSTFDHWCYVGNRKGQQSLNFFLFMDAFLGSSIILAECLRVFAIAGLSLSFLEVEEVVYSFMEVILKCRDSD